MLQPNDERPKEDDYYTCNTIGEVREELWSVENKIDRLTSKADDILETLKQLLALKECTATQSCTHDPSTTATIITKDMDQNSLVNIPDVSTLYVEKKVKMPNSVGKFRISTVVEVQKDWSLSKTLLW